MNSLDLDELIALDAVGALDEADQRRLRDRLSSASTSVRDSAAQVYDVAATMASQTAASQTPSAALRHRLMARVSSPGKFSVLASEGTWLQTPIPGLAMKVLALDKERDSAVLLMKVQPGTRYPAHHHSGAEECYVLAGEVTIQGRRLHAGDFHHAEPGSDHDELYSEPGCELLLVVAASDNGL